MTARRDLSRCHPRTMPSLEKASIWARECLFSCRQLLEGGEVKPCQTQTPSSDSQLIGWEAFPPHQTSPLPIIPCPQSPKMTKNITDKYIYIHIYIGTSNPAMTAGYIAMPLQEPLCPFCPLLADSYIPLLMCWIYFFSHQALLLLSLQQAMAELMLSITLFSQDRIYKQDSWATSLH